MRIVIDQTVLAKTLARVAGIVERRNTIPIIGNVLLAAAPGGFSIAGTDLDMEATATAAILVDRPGSCTAPAHTLTDIVKRLAAGAQVELTLDDKSGQLLVRSGRSKFSLATLPTEDFPVFGVGDFTCEFEVDSAALAGLIDATRFAISTEEPRYYLNGSFLHCHGEAMRITTTDGHRLAVADTALPAGAASLPAVIIPKKAVVEIRKLLDGAPATVSLAVSATKLKITVGATVLSTKLIDGTFPDYQRIIPTANANTLEVDAAELADAVERVSTISSEKSRAVKLTLDRDEMTVEASSAENGQAADSLDPERARWSGAPLQVGFNARYLLDIIAASGADRLKLAMDDPASPCVITDAAANSDANSADRLFVLMPMRV